MFPIDLKNKITENLKADVAYLLEEFPDIKTNLLMELEVFSISHKLLQESVLKAFIEDNKNLIISKYNQFIKPRFNSSEESAESMFGCFVDDFYEFSVYKCAESDDYDVCFDELWEKFQGDFFSDKVEMNCIVRLFGLYGATSVGLENVIPYENIELISPITALDYRMMGWERNGDSYYNFAKSFDELPWIFFRLKNIVSRNNSLQSQINESIDKFNLITFIFRNVMQSTVYFNDIRIFGLGHYSPTNYTGEHMLQVFDNDIYQKIGHKMILKHPKDVFIRSVLTKCEGADYTNYVFQDWQMKIRNILGVKRDFEWSTTKQKYYLFDCLLNLTFVLNSLLPDLGNRENSEFRKTYLPLLMQEYFGRPIDKTKDDIENLYNIRNEIAHGYNEKANILFFTKFCNVQNFYDSLLFFEIILSDLIILSLVNQGLRDILEQWHKSQDKDNIPLLIKPYSF